MNFDKTWVDKWIEAVNQEPNCRHNGRHFDGSFSINADAARFTFHVRAGKIERLVEDGGPLEPSAFTLTAPKPVWEKLFAPDPEPMFHAIFAAIGSGNMTVEGDIQTLFQQMLTLSDWVIAGRALNGTSTLAADPAWPDSYQAVGRYVNVEVDGVKHKVFYFEAGDGIPVLCQHTAGNENRQWRHLLEDRELTQKYRFIAYDLPSHGKSDPPSSGDFFNKDLLLKSDWITKFVVALSAALELDRPIFLGCSIGGVIACHLAEKYPEQFRGLVGMAGAIPTHGFFHDWWINPNVNAAMMLPGVIDSVMAPGISKRDREINRMCQSTHPKTMRNDLYFWGEENADPQRAERIDPSKVPLYLYAGEYDFTCPPELIEQTAKSIGPEVHFEVLSGLGHFPMSENYALFRPTLVKTLAAIGDAELSREAAE
ncbi:MAG TPA: alpha/beta hydrolase [Sneathiellales bacterium]|nr:alpha/beta hydrolase [Sneathiellales bacterium]